MLFVGCTTQPLGVRDEYEKLNQLSKSRYQNDALVQSIRHKLWLVDGEATPLSYFTNNDYATEADRKSLERIHEIATQNFRDAENFVRKHRGVDYLSVMEAYRAASFSLFLKLYEGRISYGQYHKSRSELSSKHREAMAQTDREVIRQRRETESGAAASFIDFLVGQQLIDSGRQPIYPSRTQSVLIYQPLIIEQQAPPPPVNIRPLPYPHAPTRTYIPPCSPFCK